MSNKHMVAAINQALDMEMQKDDKIVLLGEDVGVDGGVFRVTDGLIDKYGEDRVIDTPLAEAGIVGAAIGMAINGLKPVPEIQFSGFMFQAFHHIKQHMARFRQRTEGTLDLQMVLRAPSTGGIRALEHHSESPENFYVHCQGLHVVVPSGPYDAKGLMLTSLRSKDPVIFLEPKKLYRSFKEDVPDEEYTIPFGKANIRRKGEDVTVVTWGSTVHVVEEAAKKLEEKGVSIEIIDIRTLNPLDEETILESVKKTNRAVIAHESPGMGGFGAEIASRIQEKALYYLEAPIRRATSFDIPYPQFAHEQNFMVNPERVMFEVLKTMED